MRSDIHTPSPWSILDRNTLAARIIGPGGRPTIADHINEADASLLAAAPELLSSLKIAVARLEDIAAASDKETVAIIGACRQAIRKAEG